MLQDLTAEEWQDWRDFASVEPIGPERDDYRMAYAIAGLAAMWATEGEIKLADFMIDWLQENNPADQIERALNPTPEMIERMEEKLKARILTADPTAKEAGPPKQAEKPKRPEPPATLADKPGKKKRG